MKTDFSETVIMLTRCLAVMFLTVLATVSAFPARPEERTPELRKPWENEDIFEGDILRNPETEFSRQAMSVAKKDKFLWPGGLIHYRIAPILEPNRMLIEKAMRHIENVTCIQFKERVDEKAFLGIVSDDGCYSHVGRTGYAQPLSLGKGCMSLGVIVHELNHAIGFFHEHTRSDRDDYVEIEWDNIKEGYEEEFDKMLPSEHRLLSDFDYSSVMMYGKLAFSKDNVLNTIIPTTPGVDLPELSQKLGLSESDISRINEIYHCNSIVSPNA